MSERSDKEKPYEPKHKGFDVEATERAQKTAERSNEVQAGRGEYVDAAYMEDGPDEAALRRGEDKESVGDAIEKARERGKRK